MNVPLQTVEQMSGERLLDLYADHHTAEEDKEAIEAELRNRLEDPDRIEDWSLVVKMENIAGTEAAWYPRPKYVEPGDDVNRLQPVFLRDKATGLYDVREVWGGGDLAYNVVPQDAFALGPAWELRQTVAAMVEQIEDSGEVSEDVLDYGKALLDTVEPEHLDKPEAVEQASQRLKDDEQADAGGA